MRRNFNAIRYSRDGSSRNVSGDYPVLVGFVPKLLGSDQGPEILGGLLAGVTVSGVLMAIFQSNSGGAWDNAKK